MAADYVDVDERPTGNLWAEIDGDNYSQGRHESLASACRHWGGVNSSGIGYEAMRCFIEVVRRQGDEIKKLREEIDYLKDLVDA